MFKSQGSHNFSGNSNTEIFKKNWGAESSRKEALGRHNPPLPTQSSTQSASSRVERSRFEQWQKPRITPFVLLIGRISVTVMKWHGLLCWRSYKTNHHAHWLYNITSHCVRRYRVVVSEKFQEYQLPQKCVWICCCVFQWREVSAPSSSTGSEGSRRTQCWLRGCTSGMIGGALRWPLYEDARRLYLDPRLSS